ncbi:MAG: secretin N-terminal domain-containing protein, partial [Deltaproteobacteria bacterium]
MKIINWKRFCFVLMSLSMILGLLAFNPNISSGSPKDDTLRQMNEQITLLYIDAVALYKSGKYSQALLTVGKIQDLVRYDPYVYKMRTSLKLQPTEPVLDEFSAKLKQKEIEYETGWEAFNKGDYTQAKEIFQELQKSSPESEEIAKVVKSIEDKESRSRLRQEELKKSAEEKQQITLQRKAREEELARQKQLQQEETARRQQQLLAQKEKEAEAREAARLQRIKEQEQQKAERLRILAEEKQSREQELALKKKIREKELAAKKMAEEKRREEERIKREAQLKKDMQLKAEKERRLAEDRKAREEELARQKQLQQEEAARRQQQLLAQKAERDRRLTEEKQSREQELALKKKIREKELAAKKMAEEKRREETVLKGQKLKEDALARREADLRRQLAVRERELEAQKVKLSQAPQQPVVQPAVIHKAQALPDKSRTAVLEEMLAEAKLKKQKEDQAKIVKIEKLWQEARQLYKHGMYEESVKYFQEIIRLEGNPRIKYTPYAKEYIEKAQAKIDEKKESDMAAESEKADKAMINEVIKQDIPPYVEPPEKVEKVEEAPRVEPPLIRKKLKKKINMDFDKVDLKSVILFLSQEAGVNFVASQKVLDLNLKVSSRFTDTPVDEVIKYVTKSLGLIYRIDKDIVWIAHPEEIAQEALETRVYYLSKGGGLFTEFTPISSSNDTGLGGSSSQVSKVFTIVDTLKEVVPWPPDAKITYDKRLNALIVRNSPQNLQMLEDMIYSLDITPCQVLIEARFLEVDITDTKELGLTWNFNNDFPVQEKDGSFSHGIAKNSGVDFSSFTRASEGLNLTYKGLLTNPQFQTVLHALEDNQKVKTLSSPRITTLNNQMATIKVVDEWIYPTRYEFEVVQFDLNGDGDFNDAGETVFKNVPKDFIRRDVGILLKVIPAVGADKKTISLSIIPEVSEATADFFVFTGDVKLPKFTSRNLSTTVVANSGDTVV